MKQRCANHLGIPKEAPIPIQRVASEFCFKHPFEGHVIGYGDTELSFENALLLLQEAKWLDYIAVSRVEDGPLGFNFQRLAFR